MIVNTKSSVIYISSEIDKILDQVLESFKNQKIFILVDENTKQHCLPIINGHKLLIDAKIIVSKGGEINKTLKTIEKIWNFLTQNNANRNSLLINLGGGVICDMGGFAASTFKRGMSFVNIPTTLLSQVDASVGGKTGFNFGGLKNEIGVFADPTHVIVDSGFNKTLDKRNILSGWAEMLKHALIFWKGDWANLVSYNINRTGFKDLNQLITRSVNIKKHFVEQDPTERNIRKALNFGHTFGHAFESLFIQSENNLLHGEAIAHGIICELYLSYRKLGFDINELKSIVNYILNLYPKIVLNNSDFDQIIELINHDKKNTQNRVNFTLLEDFGKIKINQNCDKAEMIDALTWYNTL